MATDCDLLGMAGAFKASLHMVTLRVEAVVKTDPLPFPWLPEG